MNEQNKITLPGSISNIPTTNYGRAYSVVSTWAHQYNVEEMRRLLVGRGIDIRDINVEEMHRLCRESCEGLTPPEGSVEVTFEDGTKESVLASRAMMQPKTPEEHENVWTERKRGLILAALARHHGDVEKTVQIEKLTEKFIGPDSNIVTQAEAMGRLMDLLGANTLEPDQGWIKYIEGVGLTVDEITKRELTPIRWHGESEFSRIDGQPVFKPGFLDDLYLRLDGAREIHVSAPSSNAEDMLGLMFNRSMQRYGHSFRVYAADVTHAIRKAKRLKNQRRRRNAKARRKTK